MLPPDRSNSISKNSPSSLLPEGQRGVREESLPRLSPSSLLPEKPEGGAAVREETLPQHSPSSLLPDAPQGWSGSRVEEPLPQDGPSSLLGSSPTGAEGSPVVRLRMLWADWRVRCAAVAAFVLVSAVSVLIARYGLQPAQDPELLLVRGTELQRKGDLPAATIAFTNLVQQRPDDPRARYLLGSVHHANGEFIQAERNFRSALELGFDREPGTVALARTLLLQGQFQKVLDEIPPVSDVVGEHEVAIASVRGLAYLGSGKSEDAESLFKRVLEVNPSAIDATLGMARIAARQNRYAEAERLIDQGLQVDPRSLDALLLKAELLVALQRPEQARAAFRKVLEAYPANPQAHVSLAWMAIQAGQEAAAQHHSEIARKAAPESPQTNYVHALLEFRRRNLASAKEAVDRALRSSPTDVPSLLLAGAIAYAEEQYLKAQQLLLRGLTRHPTHVGGRKLYGATLMKMGQPSSALNALLPTLQIAAKDGELYTLIGQAYMQAGDYASAAKYLDRASEFRPQDLQAKYALGLSHMAAGQLSQALDALQSGLRSDASTSELDALLVAVQLRLRNIERAEQAWAAIHRKQPNSTTTLQLKAAILTAKGDLPGARKALEQALMVEPTFVPAAVGLARLDLGDNDPLNARQRLERILRSDPRNADAMLALAEIGPAVKATTAEIKGWLTDARKLKPSSARVSVLLAKLLLETGNAQEALAIARESVRAHPENPALLEALGAAQTAVGNADAALGTFATLAVLMPQSMEVMYKLAVAQAATGSDAAAAISLRKVLSQVPDHLGALSLLARLHLRGGRPEETVALARKLQANKRTAAAGHLLEGDAMRAADPRHAVEFYEIALRLEPSGEGIVRLHDSLSTLGRSNEADERLRRWINERPDDWRARLYWADTLLARRNYAQATPHYLAAAAQYPDNPNIHNNLAIAMARTRDQRALQHAQRAHALRPNDSAILDTLGWIHMQRGELDPAIEFLQRSIAVQPDHWEPRLHLAQAYERAKDFAKARIELEQALQANPPADRAEEMKRTLQDLPL